MNRTGPQILDLAYRLLAYEAEGVDPSESSIPTTVRISEKLRRPISMLAGATGFLSLLARALNLAKKQDPRLGVVQVKPDGSLDGFSEIREVDAEEAGVVLIAHLLGLLSNFIGEALTLRLLHDAWPDLPVIDKNFPGEPT